MFTLIITYITIGLVGSFFTVMEDGTRAGSHLPGLLIFVTIWPVIVVWWLYIAFRYGFYIKRGGKIVYENAPQKRKGSNK